MSKDEENATAMDTNENSVSFTLFFETRKTFIVNVIFMTLTGFVLAHKIGQHFNEIRK